MEKIKPKYVLNDANNKIYFAVYDDYLIYHPQKNELCTDSTKYLKYWINVPYSKIRKFVFKNGFLGRKLVLRYTVTVNDVKMNRSYDLDLGKPTGISNEYAKNIEIYVNNYLNNVDDIQNKIKEKRLLKQKQENEENARKTTLLKEFVASFDIGAKNQILYGTDFRSNKKVILYRDVHRLLFVLDENRFINEASEKYFETQVDTTLFYEIPCESIIKVYTILGSFFDKQTSDLNEKYLMEQAVKNSQSSLKDFTKNKSNINVGGAIVGGIVAGTPGAILGGLSNTTGEKGNDKLLENPSNLSKNDFIHENYPQIVIEYTKNGLDKIISIDTMDDDKILKFFGEFL